MALKITAEISGGDDSPFKKSDDFFTDFGEAFDVVAVFALDLRGDLAGDLLFEADFRGDFRGLFACAFLDKPCDLLFEAWAFFGVAPA